MFAKLSKLDIIVFIQTMNNKLLVQFNVRFVNETLM